MSDEWSYKVADKLARCYHLYATMLHLPEIDRHITGAFGETIREILA